MNLPEWMPVAVFFVAFLFSLVGHGGASGYLALLAFAGFAQKQVSSLVLTMNLIVAGMGILMFGKAKSLSWKLAWPFLAGAVPFVVLGSTIKLSDKVWSILVAACLLAAALRMLFPPAATEARREGPVWVQIVVGAVIGVLSGMVGIGGGVFLSPILIMAKWADPKQAAPTAAVFIVVNSLAGLIARGAPAYSPTWTIGLTILTAFLGGLAGSSTGAFRLPTPALRHALGVVLLVAAAAKVLV